MTNEDGEKKDEDKTYETYDLVKLILSSKKKDHKRFLAIIHKHPERLKETECGETFYHCASYFGRDRILREILEIDSSFVNKLTENKLETSLWFNSRTPLMMAMEHGRIKCVKLLLQYNADIHIKDSFGTSACDLADKKRIIKLLDYDADIKKFFKSVQEIRISLKDEVSRSLSNMRKIALVGKSDESNDDDDDNDELSTEELSYLLQLDGMEDDKKFLSIIRETPTRLGECIDDKLFFHHIAAIFNRDYVLKEILEIEPKYIDISDDCGRTPLSYVADILCYATGNERKKCVSLMIQLLQFGADIDKKDFENKSVRGLLQREERFKKVVEANEELKEFFCTR